MRETGENPKLLKTSVILPIDSKSYKVVSLLSMKRKTKPTKDAKITFIASPTDQEIISAGLAKFGVRKMSEVIRMALKKFAEAEGLQLKAS